MGFYRVYLISKRVKLWTSGGPSGLFGWLRTASGLCPRPLGPADPGPRPLHSPHSSALRAPAPSCLPDPQAATAISGIQCFLCTTHHLPRNSQGIKTPDFFHSTGLAGCIRPHQASGTHDSGCPKARVLKVLGEPIHSGPLAVVTPALQRLAEDAKATAGMVPLLLPASLLITSHLGTTPAHHTHPRRGPGHTAGLQASLKWAPTSLLLVLRGHRRKVPPPRGLESWIWEKRPLPQKSNPLSSDREICLPGFLRPLEGMWAPQTCEREAGDCTRHQTTRNWESLPWKNMFLVTSNHLADVWNVIPCPWGRLPPTSSADTKSRRLLFTLTTRPGQLFTDARPGLAQKAAVNSLLRATR